MLSADTLIILGGCTLVALALVSGVAAWSWKAWLDLQRHQLDTGHAFAGHATSETPTIANRIDLADLRERIKKLEAIAAGVDF